MFIHTFCLDMGGMERAKDVIKMKCSMHAL